MTCYPATRTSNDPPDTKPPASTTSELHLRHDEPQILRPQATAAASGCSYAACMSAAVLWHGLRSPDRTTRRLVITPDTPCRPPISLSLFWLPPRPYHSSTSLSLSVFLDFLLLLLHFLSPNGTPSNHCCEGISAVNFFSVTVSISSLLSWQCVVTGIHLNIWPKCEYFSFVHTYLDFIIFVTHFRISMPRSDNEVPKLLNLYPWDRNIATGVT